VDRERRGVQRIRLGERDVRQCRRVRLRVQHAGGNSLGDAAGGFGVFTDGLTITSALHPNGTPGSVAFEFSVDGSVDATNGGFDPGFAQLLGHADALLGIEVNSALDIVFEDDVTLEGPQAPFTDPPNLAGFTATAGATGWTLAGAATVSNATLPFPITFGTPFTLTIGLLAEAYPQTESAAMGVANVDFSETASLTKVLVYDGEGMPVARFGVTSDSGTEYAPEPAATTAASVALAVLSLCAFRRR
jgi:hypothetical protein